MRVFGNDDVFLLNKKAKYREVPEEDIQKLHRSDVNHRRLFDGLDLSKVIDGDIIHSIIYDRSFLIKTFGNSRFCLAIDITHFENLYNTLQRDYHALGIESGELSLDVNTGVLVKKVAEQEMNAYLKANRSTNQSCALVMIDIDDFRDFNEKFGHVDGGDKALLDVATTIKNSIRQDLDNSGSKRTEDIKSLPGQKDVLGRYGGDEFFILLKNIDENDVMPCVDRIRRNVNAKGVVIPFKQEYVDKGLLDKDCELIDVNGKLYVRIPVTISCGVFSCTCGAFDLSFMIANADEALYASKRSEDGTKNKSTIFSKKLENPNGM